MIRKAIKKTWEYALHYAFIVYTFLVIVFFEKPKGVDFIRKDLSTSELSSSASIYATVPMLTMSKIFMNIPIQPDDAFLDIGCGKGYVLYIASKLGFTRVNGIELSPSLCSIANHNMIALNISENAGAECVDASEFNHFDDYSVLYMANPFSDEVMEKVVVNIEKSLRKKPRQINIIYFNPLCHQILDNCPLLQLSETRNVTVYDPFTKWKVYYYSSVYC